jgi:hypothetical protein
MLLLWKPSRILRVATSRAISSLNDMASRQYMKACNARFVSSDAGLVATAVGYC